MEEKSVPGLNFDVDPDGLLEYSVVFTDRSLNHMSASFQTVMNGISSMLKEVYNAHSVALVPGGGTYGMEAVARQFSNDNHALVVRNGFFSYRWSQILEMGKVSKSTTVMKAHPVNEAENPAYAPADIDEVTARIAAEKPAVVYAPHVETAAGLILPNDYIKSLADAAHDAGGLFVLDCIASGTLWVDMKDTGVDVLISAPQKGWSASPCTALVMLSERATERLADTTSSSFACDLRKWHDIMQAYENGGHAYHATMPTDALRKLHDAMLETKALGFDTVRQAQVDLGTAVRALLKEHGFKSVAAEGFEAPGVVVSYTDDADVQNGSRFKAVGLQVAAGVPLMIDEPESYRSFRLGLFGLDKLNNIDRTVANLGEALDSI
tara:strand:+ start:898 stop:2037 length:1140 start_codon:yes stop_codon:yes gene_type:complete